MTEESQIVFGPFRLDIEAQELWHEGKAKPLGPTLAIAGIPYIDFVDDFDAGFKKLEKELVRKGLS